LGNTALVDYGIQTEKSHIRAHVCPKARRVYVYPTPNGIEAIESGAYISRPGYQSGISMPTSLGYLVPPFDIAECVALAIRPDAWDYLNFSDEDSLTDKGNKAVRLVKGMLKRGLFPIPAIGTEITDRDLQVDGTDIIIRAGAIRQQDIVIQVKCDFPGGERDLGGTGNLFLQIAECNPLGIH